MRLPGQGRSPRRLARIGSACAWWLAVALLACAACAAHAAELRFPEAGRLAALSFGASALSADERAFLAALPAVRVGIVDTPPYQVVSADGEVSGIHTEMLVALANAFGVRLQPTPLPDWPSAFAAMRERRIDLLMSVGVSPQRMNDMAFTLGVTPAPAALFARPGHAATAIDRARFAVERGYLADELLPRLYPKATFEQRDSTLAALQAVADGSADYYIGSLLEASALLAREPVPGVEAARLFGYGTGHYHFAVRKDWATLAAILDKGTHTLRAAPSAELMALLGQLPAYLKVPAPLPLSGAEAALLSRHPVWRVGAVQGLALLNDIDASGVHGGIASEYTAQVMQRLGIAVQAVAFENVAAMLDALRGGRIDVVPFLTRTPEREREFAFSQPYVEMPYLLVARSDGPLYWDLASLRGKRVALAHAHPLREVLARRHPDIHVVDAPNGNAAMDRVARGEAEAAVEVKLFANLRINSDTAQSLRAVAAVSELPAQFHFATARAQEGLLPLVNRALADIAPDERERMLRRWVAIDLDPPFPWRRHLPLLLAIGAGLLALAAATSWWMRRLAREANARRRSEQLLSDIAATVPGIAYRYVLDADGSVRNHYNTPGMKSFLGVEIDPKRTVLQTLAPRLVLEHLKAAEAQWLRSIRTGEPFKVSGAYAHPDGRERWLHAEAVRTGERDGRAVWTGFIVDISTERELQRQLEREAEARNLLLASASHELRAPTHTLSLALQSLRGDGLDANQRDALRIATDSARTLGQLLNDVLDAARLDRDALELVPRDFDLHALIDEVVGAWRAAAASKGLAFEAAVAAEVPRVVHLDPLRLKQVLINLLSNACKYTSLGLVSIRVECASDALRFEIADTGVGIDAAQRARLFEPYASSSAAGAAGDASSGLGLSICRRLVALMGGTIEIDSEPGRGTRVRVEVPLPARSEAAEASDRGSTVLICDDDETSRTLLAGLLRNAGYAVVEADDGADALQRCRAGGVAALITDLHMPGLGGAELVRRLRAEEPGGRMPVIVCSGSTVAAEVPASIDVDARLVKPVDAELLVRTLLRLGVRAVQPASVDSVG